MPCAREYVKTSAFIRPCWVPKQINAYEYWLQERQPLDCSLCLFLFPPDDCSIPATRAGTRDPLVIENELNAERADTSHWMFRLETVSKDGQKEVDEVVETSAGDLKHPIVIDGRELDSKQRQQSDSQLGRNSEALRKSLKDKNQDSAKSQRMLSRLPNAFIFSYGERQGEFVQLLFKPNPTFHPRGHEAEVFHAMQGNVWVNEKQNRLGAISGRLTEPVKFPAPNLSACRMI
jgi:hypothetical protein